MISNPSRNSTNMSCLHLRDHLKQARLAWRNLARQRRRTTLALITVSGGIIAFLLAGGFIAWVLNGMAEFTIHSQLGHLQITRPGYFTTGIGDPYNHLLPSEVPASVKSIEGFVTVSPRLAFSGLLSKGEETISFIGEGIEPVTERPISRTINILKGKDLSGSDAREVLLGAGLAANLGAQPGDMVVLLATTAEGGINAVELTVSGTFSTITKAYDDVVLRTPISIARQLMRVEGATTWVVLLEETRQTAGAESRLRQLLPPKEYDVTPWTSLADFYNKTVELFSKQVGIVKIIIGLIVVLSISNTLSMAVIERTGEIGTLMAIGLKRGAILRQFLLEGALLGIIGGLVGIVLGVSLGQIVSAIGIPMPPPPGMVQGYLGEISISPALAYDALTLAFVTTLAASIFPAWKASRMNIVDALRQQK